LDQVRGADKHPQKARWAGSQRRYNPAVGKITLTGKGRRWLAGGHPWVYADDVAQGEGQPGELVPVFDPNEHPLGWGLLSTRSRIAVRMVTRSPEQPNRAFWLDRVRRCVRARAALDLLRPEGACRLIAGDADGLPGLVVDRYADLLVLQSGCQGSDRMRDFLVELVLEALELPVASVLDRSDTGVRKLEGLERRVEWLRGAEAERVAVREGDLEYEVDPLEGHKTGHYLDQRANRVRAAGYAEGARVLDAFAYDGLFGIRAALAGAESVLCLEQSAPSVERLQRNAERNGVAGVVRVERVDAMTHLKRLEQAGERFGLVVVDPPAFARNKRELEGAARGYNELNRRAMALAEPGSMVVSSSCSYNVRPPTFVEFLSRSSFDAGRDAYLHGLHGASPDHSALLTLPESSYLKCAFLRVE